MILRAKAAILQPVCRPQIQSLYIYVHNILAHVLQHRRDSHELYADEPGGGFEGVVTPDVVCRLARQLGGAFGTALAMRQ